MSVKMAFVSIFIDVKHLVNKTNSRIQNCPALVWAHPDQTFCKQVCKQRRLEKNIRTLYVRPSDGVITQKEITSQTD